MPAHTRRAGVFARAARRARFLVCAAALLAAALTPGALLPGARADTFFYGAVNNTLFECSERYMPVYLTAMIVPSGLLAEGGLGLRGSYDPEARVYTLSGALYSVTFDIGRNATYDSTRQYDERAFESSGLIYLPLDFICRQFYLTYGFIETDYGIVVRIRPLNMAASDSDFISGVSAQLAAQQARYREINGLPPLGGSNTPRPSGPTPTPVPAPAPPPMVALTLDAGDGDAEFLEEALGVIDAYGVPAAVFMTRAVYENGHALARRALERHTLGILYDGTPEEGRSFAAAALADLTAANAALRAATLSQTRFARLADTLAPDAGRLTDAGYRLWGASVYTPAVTRSRDIDRAASELMKLMDDGGEHILSAACGEFTAGLLDALLALLTERGAVFLKIGY